MKFTSAAVLAASVSTATTLSNPHEFGNNSLSGGCGACKQFTISAARGASDPSKGFSRNAILTNGTLPGPALNLKVGECVDFTVINNIGDTTGVHFHGIRQLETPWSDGTPGLSQKGIANGETYTYRWLADEPGVYFYHAHYKSQMMDGLYGAIVISAAEGTSKPFSTIGDVVALEAAEKKMETVFTSDWNQFTADEFLGLQKAANIDDACTDSITLNGYGSIICYTPEEIKANQRPQVPFILAPNTTLTPKGCIPPSNALIQGNYTRNLAALPAGAYDQCTPFKGGEYVHEVDAADGWAAMSFISPAGFILFAATIDGHKMYVYEVNGQYIVPQVVDQVKVTPGDRISFFVKLDQPAADYKIRIANDGLNQVISGFGTLRYKGSSGPGNAKAIMNIGGVSPPNSTIAVLDNAHAIPFAAPPVSVTADRTFVMNLKKNPGVKEAWQWVLNGVSPYSAEMDDQTPFLYSGPSGVPESDLVLRTNYNEWVDLIIKVAGPLAQPHPVHKHANKFYVIGSGVGAFNYSTVAEAQAAGVQFNLANPPYLDGFTSTPAQGSGTWMVFRYQANTPGAWFMHCHIQTHFSGGMAVAILDGVDKWPSVPVNPGHFGAMCAPNGTTTTTSSATSSTTSTASGYTTTSIRSNGTTTSDYGYGTTTSTSSVSTTTTYSGKGLITTSAGSDVTSSKHWGGWGDWTDPAPDATKVPNYGNGRPAVPTGHDDNYNSDDWAKWSSIESKASSLSKNGGVATTIYGNGVQDGSWGNWGDAATTTMSTKVKVTGKPVDPTATWQTWDPSNTGASDNDDWSNWNNAGPSVKSSKTSSKPVDPTATWQTWDPSNTGASNSADWSDWSSAASSVKSSKTSSKPVDPATTWATWAPGNGNSNTVKATGTTTATGFQTWAAGSSATGVAAYTGSGSGSGNPGGIATYTGAAASVKAGGIMVGAFVVGAAALLL